jgi:hypothetical protein
MNLSAQLNAKDTNGRPKDLKFSFLFSATVFLLALRYRKKDSRFLEPPAKGEKAKPIFSEALRILKQAFETVKDDIWRRRRDIHRLAPDVISNAIEFFQKTGGNPDIIVVISKAGRSPKGATPPANSLECRSLSVHRGRPEVQSEISVQWVKRTSVGLARIGHFP